MLITYSHGPNSKGEYISKIALGALLFFNLGLIYFERTNRSLPTQLGTILLRSGDCYEIKHGSRSMLTQSSFLHNIAFLGNENLCS